MTGKHRADVVVDACTVPGRNTDVRCNWCTAFPIGGKHKAAVQ